MGLAFRNKRHKIKKPLVAVSILIFIVLGVILLIRSLTSPAIGSVSQIPAKDQVTRTGTTQEGYYAGKYITFNYPGTYHKVPSRLSGNILEVADYVATDNSSEEFTVGVSQGSLSNDSGITFRRQHPDVYHEEARTMNSVTFTKSSSGFERIVFISRNNYVASVAFTDPQGTDLTADSRHVADSLKWTQ